VIEIFSSISSKFLFFFYGELMGLGELELTPWSRILLEKFTGSQLVTKFPAFYGT